MIVGLDIGGANLKAASTAGLAMSRRFALYRQPERLADELRSLLMEFPGVTQLAVTMTGELCDCYPTRRQGVLAILDAVEALGLPVRVFLTDGRLSSLAEARREPLLAAASNWLALATVAARLAEPGPGLLLDIGSTTTDIIPIRDGVPCPRGRTDPERLRSGELVYQGVRRTPVCAVLGATVAAELFATMQDVYLVLGRIAPDPTDHDTADGRPATVEAAHARLIRMVLADVETSTPEVRLRLAERAAREQWMWIGQAIDAVTDQLAAPPRTLIVAGSGRFLAVDFATEMHRMRGTTTIDLADQWGMDRSIAACAYAVARLAEEGPA